MSLFIVSRTPAASRGVLLLGCVVALSTALAGCAFEEATQEEQGTGQNSAELSIEATEAEELSAPAEEAQQDLPGGEIGDDSSDPTPDPWHSTDPTPDPWDEVDDGVGRNFAQHQSSAE